MRTYFVGQRLVERDRKGRISQLWVVEDKGVVMLTLRVSGGSHTETLTREEADKKLEPSAFQLPPHELSAFQNRR